MTPAPEIDAELIASCTNIVALAGAEQINKALATGADIVIAGRTTDTAIIAALPIARGVDALGIVTAKTQELAAEIAKYLNPYLLHHPLTAEEEQLTFAFPFSPAEIDRGAVYEFCLNHVLVLDDPMAAFSLEVLDV